MFKQIIAGLCAAVLLCDPLAGHAKIVVKSSNTADWDKLSTALAVGLIGGAAAVSFEKSDNQGVVEFAKGLGSTILLTEALKAVISEPRPDGSGNDSFPSGHTAAAFAAATYLSIRYRDSLGGSVPLLYGAAALTGVARVKADKHYAKDVVAGAVIGVGMGYVFTRPLGQNVAVYPTPDGVGATYAMKF